MEQCTISKLGKEHIKAVYCQPACLTYMQNTSCKMPGWIKHSGIKIAGRNINNLRYTDDTTLTAESEEEGKNFSMKVKENEKAGIKLYIQKTKIMASGPIPSWQIDEETMETVTDSIFLGSKITADGGCSYEIKRC